VLLTYLFLDTGHMVRNWRAVGSNWPMVLHHSLFFVIVLIGVLVGQLPRFQHISFLMLSAEFSTPSLNLRWILSRGLGFRSWPLQAALSLSFALLFTMTRVAGYALLVADLYSASVWELDMAPAIRHTFAGCITVSWLLNMYWFKLIIGSAVGGSGGGGARGG
ncbi:unnamed protein product, partial [Phaeothamnion confervicola]